MKWYLLINVLFLFLFASCTEKKEVVEKTTKLILTIDSDYGAYFTNPPEVVWYRDGVQESSEYVDQYFPNTIERTIKYKDDKPPIYKAVVNIRNGYGVVKRTNSVTFDISKRETIKKVVM